VEPAVIRYHIFHQIGNCV